MSDPTPTDLVVELLRTLDEALIDFDPGSGGDGVRLMPSTYANGSYAELERRLREMRDDPVWRAPWWHVSMRYRWGVVRRHPVRTRKTIKGRVPVLPPRCELLIAGESLGSGWQLVQYYTWTEAVRPQLVGSAVSRLKATMYDGDTTRLRLPAQFLERLLASRGGHGVQREPRDLARPAFTAP